ncbi:heat shock factor-binding protein 1 isoform X2 [Pantherophis guttatus]|uniref:Heat shock factor-binding protein 1 isoform X2 n=1 Tax=Pantherophis guttatus TaxID=94885 RepID=A0A6P9CSY3_PANGU|nr:heat shock factor-binding protein 1 isoform X2 [Pantherophis guttatus]
MLPHHHYPRVSEESLKGPRASPTGESTSFPTMQLSGLALARLGERSAVGPAFSRRRPEEPGSRAWTGDREAKQPQRTDMAETDPKTVQDLTAVVQTLLQQMQDKFQIMSDQIIGRNILLSLEVVFSLTRVHLMT